MGEYCIVRGRNVCRAVSPAASVKPDDSFVVDRAKAVNGEYCIVRKRSNELKPVEVNLRETDDKSIDCKVSKDNKFEKKISGVPEDGLLGVFEMLESNGFITAAKQDPGEVGWSIYVRKNPHFK